MVANGTAMSVCKDKGVLLSRCVLGNHAERSVPSSSLLFSSSLKIIDFKYFCRLCAVVFSQWQWRISFQGQSKRPFCFCNSFLSLQDYPEGNNSSDYLVQTTTYLPENFTYSPYLPCPEKLPYMRKSSSNFDLTIYLCYSTVIKTTWFECSRIRSCAPGCKCLYYAACYLNFFFFFLAKCFLKGDDWKAEEKYKGRKWQIPILLPPSFKNEYFG